MLDLFYAIPVYLNESNVTHPSGVPPGSFINSFSAHAHMFVRAPAVPVPARANAQITAARKTKKRRLIGRPCCACMRPTLIYAASYLQRRDRLPGGRPSWIDVAVTSGCVGEGLHRLSPVPTALHPSCAAGHAAQRCAQWGLICCLSFWAGRGGIVSIVPHH